MRQDIMWTNDDVAPCQVPHEIVCPLLFSCYTEYKTIESITVKVTGQVIDLILRS